MAPLSFSSTAGLTITRCGTNRYALDLRLWHVLKSCLIRSMYRHVCPLRAPVYGKEKERRIDHDAMRFKTPTAR